MDEANRVTVTGISTPAINALKVLALAVIVVLIVTHQAGPPSLMSIGLFVGALALLVLLGLELITYERQDGALIVTRAAAGFWALLARPERRVIAFDDIEQVKTSEPGKIVVQLTQGPAARLYLEQASPFIESWRVEAPQLFALRASERPLAALAAGEPAVHRFDIETLELRSLWPFYAFSWISRWGVFVFMGGLAVLAVLIMLNASDWVTLPLVALMALVPLSAPIFLVVNLRTAARGDAETTIHLSDTRLSIDHHRAGTAGDLDVALDDIARIDLMGRVMVVCAKDGRRGVVAVEWNVDSKQAFDRLVDALVRVRPALMPAKLVKRAGVRMRQTA